MPDCANFGVPARHQHGKPGPSANRDPHYKVHSTAKGQIPSVRCKSCKDNPPLKSNASISTEIKRLLDIGGLYTLKESTACRNAECENSNRPIASHRSSYQKRGKARTGGQYYRCKACGQHVLLSQPVRLHHNHRARAVDVFGRIINKAPMRRAVSGAKLKSNAGYYRILRFIEARCRSCSGAVDRALMDGRLRLPKQITVEADAQVYRLNWLSRLDRRNVELSTYCTVDAESRFVLGMHTNFDSNVDPFEINASAARHNELAIPEAFREHAHYWLAGDELKAGRAMSRSVVDRQDLIRQIQILYAQADSREDVENIELEQLDDSYVTPVLKGGLQVHMPYTTYAHWILLHRILAGSGVRKIQVNVDIDSMSRAAFLCAFVDEVSRGDAHLFYVRINKYLSVDERKALVLKSRRAICAFAKTLAPEIRRNPQEVKRRMMRQILEQGHEFGKWRDQWFPHPAPTLNEPEKLVSWMTPDNSLSLDQKADLFLRAGIARVDNIFQKTRRLINAFERPIGTSSGYNKVWHGYAPYNPEMVQKYLGIFRTVNNFVWVSEEDGKTPAMRLGLVKRPLELEDILWPGQKVPRLKRSRRKGRAIAV